MNICMLDNACVNICVSYTKHEEKTYVNHKILHVNHVNTYVMHICLHICLHMYACDGHFGKTIMNNLR